MTNKERIKNYDEGNLMDEYGHVVTALDDDYYAVKQELENLTNPLSDDYCKYDNE